MNLFELRKAIAEHVPYVRRIRDRVHSTPEIGTEEWKTSTLIVDELSSFGCDKVITGIVKTGVMAIIEGSQPGPVIMLRVDMDAMVTDDPSTGSKTLCHCCGHDVHTSLGLGIAKLLMQYKEQLHGTVKVFFQPSEERPIISPDQRPFDCYTEPPVGLRSAAAAIKEGILGNPKPDRILGIHCWPLLQVGKMGYEFGAAMSGTGNFRISVIGQSGHAGMPHKSVDAIVVAAEVVAALQLLVSRKRDPSIPVVLNVGTICGGVRRSVVCGRVDMAGTVRCPEPTYLSKDVPMLLEKMIGHTCEALGASHVLEYGVDQPPVINDGDFVQYCARVMNKALGGRAVELKECPFTSEDFAYLSQEVPAVYLKLGTAGGQATSYPLHDARFDVDTRCFETGLLGISSIILEYLGALR